MLQWCFSFRKYVSHYPSELLHSSILLNFPDLFQRKARAQRHKTYMTAHWDWNVIVKNPESWHLFKALLNAGTQAVAQWKFCNSIFRRVTKIFFTRFEFMSPLLCATMLLLQHTFRTKWEKIPTKTLQMCANARKSRKTNSGISVQECKLVSASWNHTLAHISMSLSRMVN